MPVLLFDADEAAMLIFSTGQIHKTPGERAYEATLEIGILRRRRPSNADQGRQYGTLQIDIECVAEQFLRQSAPKSDNESVTRAADRAARRH
jgi:hypothetical protein